MILPFLLKKEPNRKYCQYQLEGDDGKWKSIRGILPPDLLEIAGSYKKCFAWLTRYCADRSEQDRHREREQTKTERVRLSSIPTFEEFTLDWYVIGKCQWLKIREGKGHRYKEQTIKTKRARLEKYVLPAIGKKFLPEIIYEDIELLCANSCRSPQTQLHIIDDLRPIFKHAKKKKLISDNPIEYLELEKFENKHKDILTDPELDLFFPASVQEMERVHGEFWRGVFWFISMVAKNRIGETAAAQWQDFRWWTDKRFGLIGAFHLRRHIDCDREVTVGSKIGVKEEFIIIPTRAINLLKELYRISPHTQPTDFVFFGKDASRPIDPNALRRRHFRAALVRAGIKIGGRNITPHSLRYLGVTKYKKYTRQEINDLSRAHKDKGTEEIYDQSTAEEKLLEHLTPEDVKKINEIFPEK